jgi:hypothetical protein
MSRRRGSDDGTGSLDLFLDTICNAFGGIIFVSLLVCVMLQLSGRATPQTQTGDPEATMKAIRKWEALIEGQRETLAIQEIEIAGLQIDPRFEELLKLYKKLLKNLKDLKETKAKQMKAIKDVLAETDDLNKKFLKKQETLREIKDEIAAGRKEIDKIRNRSPHVLSVPTGRKNSQKQIAVFLSGGRLCFVRSTGANGQLDITKINEKEIDFTKIGQGVPKPNKGLKVPQSDAKMTSKQKAERIRTLRAKLTPILLSVPSQGPEKESYMITICVWPDSFWEFMILRATLTEMKYRYKIIFIMEGGKVFFGPSDDDGYGDDGGG